MTFQGSSKVVTPAKQYGLGGIIYMQILRTKKRPGSTIIADVFCGEGTNRLSLDEKINGSPITILEAYTKAVTAGAKTRQAVSFAFSDIRPEAITGLYKNIEETYPDLIPCTALIAGDAKDVVTMLHQELLETDHNLILVVDPNGYKDLPFEELTKLGTDPQLLKRVDIILHLSATANKRILAAAKAGINLTIEWAMPFKEMVLQIAGGRDGWIRKQLKGDAWQWTLIPLFGYSPRNDWSKNGFIKLSSDEGMALLDHYSRTRQDNDND